MPFPPLEYPKPWPPPEDESEQTQLAWGLDALKRWLHKLLHGSELQKTHYHMERQVCEQLNTRPATNETWPQDLIRRRIVESLGEAVRQEKKHPLRHVTLHRDDPIILLLWGCYDDMTPLIFLRNLETAFDVTIPGEVRRDLFLFHRPSWYDDNRSVGDLVEQVIPLVVNRKRE